MKKFISGLIIGCSLSMATVAFASNTIEAYLFPAKFNINGQIKEPTSDSPILNYNGHAYLPIRFIGESIGAAVGYNEQTTTVIVKNKPLDISSDNMPNSNIKVGNLIVTKEGDKTRVVGQIDFGDGSYFFGGNLTFFDTDGKQLGVAGFGGSYSPGIHNFEILQAGDFTNYASVKFHIAKL